MAKKKKMQVGTNDPTDIEYYLHQPHDKYVRALLQHRTAAIEIIKYVLDKTILESMDLETLQLSNTSFLNENLQLNIADICYEGFSKTGEPFRICLLFEHKSDALERVYEQLCRYISSKWLEDQKQNRPSTLPIPILIYHGATPIKKEHPATLFPLASAALLRFVPNFDYIVLDTAALSEDDIDQLGVSVLRQVLLALKFSRNESYLRKNLKKVLIFAKVFHQDPNYQLIIQYTLLYMVSVSKTAQQTLENPSTHLTVDEEELVLPYVFEKYRIKYKEEGLKEGMEKGMEKGMKLLIQKFIKNNPGMSDEVIATTFEVSLELVKAARNS